MPFIPLTFKTKQTQTSSDK